jgi:hypothetical protein
MSGIRKVSTSGGATRLKRESFLANAAMRYDGTCLKCDEVQNLKFQGLKYTSIIIFKTCMTI